MHFVLLKAGTFQEVNEYDLLVIYCLWKKNPFSLPHLIINHMIKTTKPIKFTYSVPYGMLMTFVFKKFRVSFDSELVRDDVLSWGAKNVIALKLSPQPSIEKGHILMKRIRTKRKRRRK